MIFGQTQLAVLRLLVLSMIVCSKFYVGELNNNVINIYVYTVLLSLSTIFSPGVWEIIVWMVGEISLPLPFFSRDLFGLI